MQAEILKTLSAKATLPVARLIARTPITPDTLTVTGFILNLVVATLLATGHLLAGGLLLFVSGALDLLDGALARVSQRVTRFGALLDSTLDRFSEAAILLGLLLLYLPAQATAVVLLIFATLVGSLMVSYVRARGEGLGLRCQGGLLAREWRMVLLGLGLVLNQVYIVLWVLAILTNLTALQRLVHGWREAQRHEDEARP